MDKIWHKYPEEIPTVDVDILYQTDDNKYYIGYYYISHEKRLFCINEEWPLEDHHVIKWISIKELEDAIFRLEELLN